MQNYSFDRPVIILSAPRAGSTLLFEALSESSELITIGDESHGIFEYCPQFNPLSNQCTSNQLTDEDATSDVVDTIKGRFFNKLCQQHYNYPIGYETKRLLEKTPKNALRIKFLNKIFPDALFVYLYRNPRENISSIIDGWRAGNFVTYGRLPGREKSLPWSFLLPEGWQDYNNSSIPEIAAFQWRSANEEILKGLASIDDERWIGISYKQLTEDTKNTLNKLSRFCQLKKESELVDVTAGHLELSRYTITTPRKNKWHKNANAISNLMPGLNDVMLSIKSHVKGVAEEELDLSIDKTLLKVATTPTALNTDKKIARNSPCYCGSNKKFKSCHGKLV